MPVEPTGHHQEQAQPAVVAVCSSAAAADLVATTLSVNGVTASTSAYSRVYPSVDWVEGYRVEVAADDAAGARALLAGIERDDVVPLEG